MAGRIKNGGRFAMLLPRELDPVAAGRHTPLPPSRPSDLGFGWFGFGASADPAVEDAAEAEPTPGREPDPKPQPNSKTKSRHAR
jgi:hypothetical protein